MSNYAYPIKEIIYDKEIQDFNTAGLFASIVNPEYRDMFDLTQDMIKEAEERLNDKDSMEWDIGKELYTIEDYEEAREQCEYYKKVMKERELEYIEFHCY